MEQVKRKFYLAISCFLITAQVFSQSGPGGVGASNGSSTLHLWLDANQIEGVVTGNNVSTWNDQSGYGNHASNSNSDGKPNFQSSYVNGFPTVTFDGGERLEGTITGGLDAPVTVFAVSYFDNLNQGASDYDYVFSVGSQTGANTMMGIARSASGAHSDEFLNKDGTNDNYGPTLDGQSWDICSQVHNTSSPYTELFLNGTSQTIDNNMSSALNTNSTYRVADWADSPSNSWHFSGKISEIIVYKEVLSDAEVNIVNAYLSAKYNITVSGDVYTGDDSGNANNDRDVIGIGTESDGSHSSSTAGGLTVSINSNFANGDYLVLGHNDATNGKNTGDATDNSATVEARWERDWYADITNTGTDISANLVFDLASGGLADRTGGNTSNYKLLYRSGASGNWTILATATSKTNYTVSFVDITLSSDGYYALGTIDVSNSPIGETPTSTTNRGPAGLGATDGSSNLELWLDANELEGGDGDPLVNFYDYSGNSASATTLDLNNIPVIKTNVVNGNDAIYFDGADDFIEGDLSKSLAADATVVAVGYFDQNQRANENDYLISLGDPTTANSHLSIARRKNDGSNRNKYYSWDGTQAIYGPVIDSQEWNIFYQEQTTTGNYHALYLNGASQSVSANASSFSATSTTYRIGEWQSANASGLKGYVGEVIVFDRLLNSAERNILNSYLGAKYDLTITGDVYSGDDSGNGNNDVDVAGIGKESDGSNTNANSGGMIITQNSNFGNGDYLVIGTTTTTNTFNTADASDATATLSARWQKTWWADVTDGGASMTVDVTFDFTDADEVGYPDGNTSDYTLIYRSGTSGNWTKLATASSISGDQVTFSNVTFSSDGYYTLGSTNTTLSPLPVEFSLFEATAKEAHVQLDWETQTETMNDRFVVERSIDGRVWEEIGSKPGAGTSIAPLAYVFIDYQPVQGTSFYRLKQIDFNGAMEYSEVRTVNFGELKDVNLPKVSTIYPNPSAGQFKIELSNPHKENVEMQWTLFDVSGSLVAQEGVSLQAGDGSILLDATDLKEGVYLLELKSANGTVSGTRSPLLVER